jgi:hypothetical protein
LHNDAVEEEKITLFDATRRRRRRTTEGNALPHDSPSHADAQLTPLHPSEKGT